jgi:hypothetical protein
VLPICRNFRAPTGYSRPSGKTAKNKGIWESGSLNSDAAYFWRHGGIMPEAGQVLYDNDPRYRGRKIEVVRVEGSYAICKSGPRQVKVRLDRIYSDGIPRRSGYSTIAEHDILTTKNVRGECR